jgi:glycosyltransferase involved in cell wall biosynthesis
MQAPPWRERLRLFWWRRFDYILVYTDQEAKQLRTHGFGRKRVIGMNNGLDQQEIDRVSGHWGERALEEWRRQRGLDGHVQVLSCARLEPKNEFDLWLTAMPAVMSRHPSLLWCVIGDGRERAALERRARELGVADHVRWLGAVTDEAELAPWFLTSRLLVHPAGIGLTLLHAFGYGLPVVTHDEPAAHNPEIAAFLPGETGLAYRRGDAASLADAVSRCLEDDVARHRMGERERRIAREEYNVDVMAERWARMTTEAAAGVRAAPGS